MNKEGNDARRVAPAPIISGAVHRGHWEACRRLAVNRGLRPGETDALQMTRFAR